MTNSKNIKWFVQILLTGCVLAMAAAVQAQDTIIKKNGDILRAKITEIGIEEVKFKTYGDPESPVITLKKSEIKTAKVAGQTIIDVKGESENVAEDIIVKKNGDLLKVKVLDIGTEEIKFKLNNDPYGPTISIEKSEIKTMKVGGQTVIDVKTGLNEDVISKKDGSVIKAKIIEMGTEEVKFKLYNNPDGPTMSLEKSEINSIKIEGQIVYEYKEDPRSISNKAILDKTSCLKFYFFSPLNHHIAFGYEWMNKPGFNWEAGLGIIGPGTGVIDDLTNRKSKGVFLRFGSKLLLGSSSDIEIEGAKYAHPLKGRYFKVEMILNSLSTTQTVDTGYYGNTGKMIYTNKYQSMTFDIGYGRQFIFGNTVTVGWYLGLGYSFENKTSTLVTNTNYWWDDYDPRRYSHTYFGKTFPLATTVRFTIGYILRTPDWLVNKKAAQVSNRPPSRHSMSE